MSDTAQALLLAGLEVSVMIDVVTVRELPLEERLGQAVALAQELAEHGDDLLYRSERKGASAHMFSVITRALAIASLQPGGVTFAGRHWEHT